MAWLLVSLLSGAVAVVGFWRGSPVALAAEAMPGIAGVLFGLLMHRAAQRLADRAELGAQGGWPLRAAGALSLTAALAGAVDVGVWLQSRHVAFGALAAPICVLAFVLTMITALRLSAASPRATPLRVLALVAGLNAAASVWLFLATQPPGLAWG